MDLQELKKYEDKISNVFKNTFFSAIQNAETGILFQIVKDGKHYTYANEYTIRKYTNKSNRTCLLDSFYEICFDNVYKRAINKYGHEFIEECFEDYFTYLKSTDKNNCKITFPYYNENKQEHTWLVVNGFVLERDKSGLPFMSGATFYEIEEQKELKEKINKQNRLLRHQVNYFKTAEEVGNLGSFYGDINKYVRGYWASDNYAKMLGMKVEEDKYYSYIDREKWIDNNVLEEDKENLYKYFRDFLTGNKPNIEYVYRAKVNGKIKWLETKSNALETNEQGGVVRYIGTVKDITQIKENELKLYNAMKLAEKDNDAKTSFIAHISHEIRTPLNAIIGYTNLISNVRHMKRVKEYSRKINFSAKILLSLINDVLDLSKITSNTINLERVDFDFKKEFTDLIESFKIFVDEKDLELVYYVDKNIPPIINADLLKIKQVLSNLLNNSIKFTNEGYVSIKVYYENIDDEGTLSFEISDTGIGIKESQINSLFKPFTQADNSTTRKYGGTGLGLTICKQLIDLMGGDIRVNSKVNYGTTFSFNVPINIVSPDVEIELIEGNKVCSTDKKILIVEDNEVNSLLIEELLRANNVNNIKLSSNGEEAIDELKKEDFDIILMDIQMPVMDGIQTTKYIRENMKDNDVKIIALTANVLKEQINEYLSVGFDDYISKPVDLNILLNKIYI